MSLFQNAINLSKRPENVHDEGMKNYQKEVLNA